MSKRGHGMCEEVDTRGDCLISGELTHVQLCGEGSIYYPHPLHPLHSHHKLNNLTSPLPEDIGSEEEKYRHYLLRHARFGKKAKK